MTTLADRVLRRTVSILDGAGADPDHLDEGQVDAALLRAVDEICAEVRRDGDELLTLLPIIDALGGRV